MVIVRPMNNYELIGGGNNVSFTVVDGILRIKVEWHLVETKKDFKI